MKEVLTVKKEQFNQLEKLEQVQYINNQLKEGYNVFCMNPQEVDEKKLDLLTWTDLARICGYDIDGIRNLYAMFKMIDNSNKNKKLN